MNEIASEVISRLGDCKAGPALARMKEYVRYQDVVRAAIGNAEMEASSMLFYEAKAAAGMAPQLFDEPNLVPDSEPRYTSELEADARTIADFFDKFRAEMDENYRHLLNSATDTLKGKTCPG